jgi:glutamate-5-semialdehyde dehydrogenase
MSTTTHTPADLAAHCRAMAERARQAAIELGGVSTEQKAAGLRRAAAEIRADTALILAANRADLEASAGAGLTAAASERLLLDEQRVEGIAAGLEAVAALPDPVGEVIESSIRPSGLAVRKIRVPLGVIFFIY